MNDNNSDHEYDECSLIRDDSLKQVRGLFCLIDNIISISLQFFYKSIL